MAIEDEVRAALMEVMDPELGISVVDLGLIYGIEVLGGRAEVKMTFTTPACPMLNHIISDVEGAVKKVKGVKEVDVQLVWEPRWTPERITEEGKKKLGLKE